MRKIVLIRDITIPKGTKIKQDIEYRDTLINKLLANPYTAAVGKPFFAHQLSGKEK